MKVPAIVAVLVLLAGCTSNPSAREEAIINLSVSYATAKYIEQRPDSRENIVQVATAAKAVIGGEFATLLTLKEFVGQELDKLSLSPADRVLADGLVALVAAELDAKIGEGVLSPDQHVRVDAILDLVIATAS